MKYINVVLLLFSLFLSLHVEGAQDNSWYIRATSRENYTGATLANGRIGLVSGSDLFTASEIVLGGVYDKEFEGGVSKIVRAPNFTHLTLKIDGVEVNASTITDWEQLLNMKGASLKTSFSHHETKINYTLRALRNLPYMAMGVMEISTDKDILIEVINKTVFYEEQQQSSCQFKRMRDLDAIMPILVSEASSRTGLHKLATCTAFLFDEKDANNQDVKQVKGNNRSLFFTKRLSKGQTYRFALIGLELTDEDISQHKVALPKEWKSLTIKGLGPDKKEFIIKQ